MCIDLRNHLVLEEVKIGCISQFKWKIDNDLQRKLVFYYPNLKQNFFKFTVILEENDVTPSGGNHQSHWKKYWVEFTQKPEWGIWERHYSTYTKWNLGWFTIFRNNPTFTSFVIHDVLLSLNLIFILFLDLNLFLLFLIN